MDAAKLGPIKGRQWQNVSEVQPEQWKCGYCGREVASNKGFIVPTAGTLGFFGVRLCGNCNAPTFFTPDGDYAPGAPAGHPVEHVPSDLDSLFTEARQAVAVGAHTAAVLTCRKMLMHIAVQSGAKPGESFLSYVEYLANKGYVPPNGKAWVDYIRTRSNEANHDIVLMTRDDALALVGFVEMLLKFIYEIPNLVPPTVAQTAAP